MGALTSAPYTFRARKWELTNTESLDIFDIWGDFLIFETDNANLKRNLPIISKIFNFNWITDISRFSYLSLSIERLGFLFMSKIPILSRLNSFFDSEQVIVNLEGSFCPISYQYFICQLFLIVFQSKFILCSNFFLGNFCNIESLILLKFFFNSILPIYNIGSINILRPSVFINNDFRHFFLFNKFLFEPISASTLIFLLNCNLDIENPLLSLFLRTKFKLETDLCLNFSGLKGFRFFYFPQFIFSFFSFSDFFSSGFLGNLFYFFLFLSGRFFINKCLFKCSLFFFFCGSSLFRRLDFYLISSFLFFFNFLFINSFFISNFLVDFIGQLQFNDLNIINHFNNFEFYNFENSFSFPFLIFFQSRDWIYLQALFSRPVLSLVCQTHFLYDSGFLVDFLFPITSYGEFISTYFSILGRYNKTNFFLLPFYFGKPEWVFFQLLFLFADYFFMFPFYLRLNCLFFLESTLTYYISGFGFDFKLFSKPYKLFNILSERDWIFSLPNSIYQYYSGKYLMLYFETNFWELFC